MTRTTVTQQNITDGLRALGLHRGHAVLAHSSLSSFGYVEGGADAVIDALLETVGQEGTVYLTIPGTGTGKVNVSVQKRLKVFNAISEGDQEIKTGEQIRVVRVVPPNVLVVEKLTGN